jgi:hypothetical protein
VAEHASLGVSSGATGVDQAYALAGALSPDLICDKISLHILTECQEIFPSEESLVLQLSGQLVHSVNHDSLDVGEFAKVDLILLKLLDAIHHNQLCL